MPRVVNWLRQKWASDQKRSRFVRVAEMIFALLMLLTIVGIIDAAAAPPQTDSPLAVRGPLASARPADTPERAREEAEKAIARALDEVRLIKHRSPSPEPAKVCALMARDELWLHRTGLRPKRRMSVAAALGAGAQAAGFGWSHALPGSLLFYEIDFGPQRQPMTAAEWLCAVDRLTGGSVELQIYPQSKHLFAGEAAAVAARSQEEAK